jgi:hypothetical protein
VRSYARKPWTSALACFESPLSVVLSAKWLVDAVAQRQSAARLFKPEAQTDESSNYRNDAHLPMICVSSSSITRQTFEIAVNEALAPYQVKFLPCQSLFQDGQREFIVPGRRDLEE